MNTKQKIGRACMIVGILLILGALALLGYNQWDANRADKASQEALGKLEETLTETIEDNTEEEIQPELDPEQEMTVTDIDGWGYIGYLSIPSIGLELPVMSEWSYPKLKISPCRQFGSSRTDDLVIAAHNYESHFGKLTSLTAGDSVTFTDMDGIVNEYVVNKVEVLDPHSVEEVEHSGYALVLYTCTYGGKTRVTVFCDRAS